MTPKILKSVLSFIISIPTVFIACLRAYGNLNGYKTIHCSKFLLFLPHLIESLLEEFFNFLGFKRISIPILQSFKIAKTVNPRIGQAMQSH